MEADWNLEDSRAIESAHTFEDLLEVALKIIDRLPQPLGMVCGPITTGGLGCSEKNLEVLEKTIENLRKQGLTIFSQLPFEMPMFRIKKTTYYKGGSHLLETFYLPIFESGKVKRFYFIKGWESSGGATWENKQAKRIGIAIIYLP